MRSYWDQLRPTYYALAFRSQPASVTFIFVPPFSVIKCVIHIMRGRVRRRTSGRLRPMTLLSLRSSSLWRSLSLFAHPRVSATERDGIWNSWRNEQVFVHSGTRQQNHFVPINASWKKRNKIEKQKKKKKKRNNINWKSYWVINCGGLVKIRINERGKKAHSQQQLINFTSSFNAIDVFFFFCVHFVW